MNTKTDTLYRPLSGRILGGVCAGLAQRFGWNPATVRILFLLSCLLPGPQFIAYIAMWIIIPGETWPPRVRVSE
jgi:phage shock protein PspC (stress-responsive transcriptional regulator)